MEDDEPKEHFPVAKRKNHFLEFYVDPVTHLSYALTWFSLAIAGAVISYHLLKRGRRLEMIKMRQMKKDWVKDREGTYGNPHPLWASPYIYPSRSY